MAHPVAPTGIFRNSRGNFQARQSVARDVAAGTAKRDERGRVVDIHALRHTFRTHLSKAGVAPRVAMAAMRRSSLDLTMNIYADPVLLDIGAAVDALPAFGAAKSTDVAVRRA